MDTDAEEDDDADSDSKEDVDAEKDADAEEDADGGAVAKVGEFVDAGGGADADGGGAFLPVFIPPLELARSCFSRLSRRTDSTLTLTLYSFLTAFIIFIFKSFFMTKKSITFCPTIAFNFDSIVRALTSANK